MAMRAAIVGAGISGLATAWNLEQRSGDVAVDVWEASPHLGGTAQTIDLEGYRLETGPNGFLDSRQPTVDLCRQLGIESRLVRALPEAKNRYIFLGDRLRRLPTGPWDFVTSDLLSWRGKVRLLAERWMKPRSDEGDESIYEFGCRRIGREATETLLDAFVTGILGGDIRELSLPASFPRMREMELKYGSLFRAMSVLSRERRRQGKEVGGPAASPQGHLTSFDGGMKTLIQSLGGQLRGRIHAQQPIRSLVRLTSGRWRLEPVGKEYDAVTLACPGPAQADILASLDAELSREIAGIAYGKLAVVVVGYRREDIPRPIDGFGYLTPERLGRPVLGVIFSSAVFPHQAPEGCVALRAMLGGPQRPEVVDWPEGELIRAVRDDLAIALGVTAEPNFRWIYRWPRAIPQYHLGHGRRLHRIADRVSQWPGIFLTGNCYRGVAFNDCVVDATMTAEKISNYLGSLAEPARR
jgi:oxygen-dependent protoporphyrinogen oxidase